MEKNRQIKIMFIVALVLSVTAMTLGFAAFSTTLNISSSASVTPNSNDFSIRIIGTDGDDYVRVVDTNASGDVAVVDNKNLVISGMKANFTKPGDYVIYGFYIENTGQYDAYLNNFTIKKIEGESYNAKCIVGEGTTTSFAKEACKYISLTYRVKDENGVFADVSDSSNINFLLKKGSRHYLEVRYMYKVDGVVADGPFEAQYGDLAFSYSTVSGDAARLISFTVRGTSYQAEEGMTWGEWIDSDYNDGAIFVSSSGELIRYQYNSDCMCVISYSSSLEYVSPDELIEERDYVGINCAC